MSSDFEDALELVIMWATAVAAVRAELVLLDDALEEMTAERTRLLRDLEQRQIGLRDAIHAAARMIE